MQIAPQQQTVVHYYAKMPLKCHVTLFLITILIFPFA